MLERPFTKRAVELLSRLGYVVILCAMVGATDGLSRALFATPLTSTTQNSEEEEKDPRERHLVVFAHQVRRTINVSPSVKLDLPIPENSSPSLSVNVPSAPILCGAGIYQHC